MRFCCNPSKASGTLHGTHGMRLSYVNWSHALSIHHSGCRHYAVTIFWEATKVNAAFSLIRSLMTRALCTVWIPNSNCPFWYKFVNAAWEQPHKGFAWSVMVLISNSDISYPPKQPLHISPYHWMVVFDIVLVFGPMGSKQSEMPRDVQIVGIWLNRFSNDWQNTNVHMAVVK